MPEPELELPWEPWQDGALPRCRKCANNGLRIRLFRGWRIMACGHCGHNWRERCP